jgi:hypothetical protein
LGYPKIAISHEPNAIHPITWGDLPKLAEQLVFRKPREEICYFWGMAKPKRRAEFLRGLAKQEEHGQE